MSDFIELVPFVVLSQYSLKNPAFNTNKAISILKHNYDDDHEHTK